MNENNLEDIQNLLRRFQKKMMTKSTTVRGQWNCVTCLKNISQVQLARRMNVLGINATMSEVAQLFHYMGFRKNSMNFDDFMNLMEVDPASLGTQSPRSLSQPKDLFEHETMREYENDYNTYCKGTTNYKPTSRTLDSTTSRRDNKKTKKVSRPFTASTSQISRNTYNNNTDYNTTQTNRSRKQDDVIRTTKNRSNTNFDDEDIYNLEDNQTHDHDHSNTIGNGTTFSYEPCRTCLERSLPRTISSQKTREATLQSFSSSSIQRQEYDGTEPLKRITRDTGVPMRTLIRKISEICYAQSPSTWLCFLKWRDHHHDLLDANDLRNGLKYTSNYIITQADAQKVIDRYGGPMNHSVFAEMIHDGSPFNTEKTFTDEDTY